MAQVEQQTFANLVAEISLVLPESEQAKIDAVTEQAPRMEKAFGSFARGGAAIFAAFSAVALLFGAGGFRTIIDLLFQTVSLLSAILIAPVIEGLVNLARETKKEQRDIEERGFFTPERIGAIIIGAITTGLILFFTGASFITALGVGLLAAFFVALKDSKLWTGIKQILSGIFKTAVGLLISPFNDTSTILIRGLKEIWRGLKNVGEAVWGVLPENLRRVLTSAASMVKTKIQEGAKWLQDHINPVSWAQSFVNWLRSVDWSEVFTFDIPGVNITGEGGWVDSTKEAGSSALSWIERKAEEVI